MRRLTLLSILLGISVLLSINGLQVQAQNPIVPVGMYIADPEAHVWEDGKLYVYGSRDESNDFWCSHSHHVLSTFDLIHWNIEEKAFASTGENDQVAYSDDLLFAPDCAARDGIWYLYYCSPGKPFTEGVATASSPYGPFTNGRHIKGAYQIDPAVLIDDDGQGYFYWGQGSTKVAKLKPDLLELDTTTIVEPLDAKGTKAFHEGSSIRKINSTYYLVFADESRRDMPTCLGYATSKHPMGPFEYQGIIIDNYGCDPSVWNNHGSIEKFKGQWYVFYHRSTHHSQKFRKACLEPITINMDGSIDEVEMTSQGAGPPLLANNRIEAEWACDLSDSSYVCGLSSTDIPVEGLTNVYHGDLAEYRYLDFGSGIDRFQIKTAGISQEGSVEILLDSLDGRKIGSCEIHSCDQKNNYQISDCEVDQVSGIHALILKFSGGSEALFDIDWFSFLSE